MNKTIYIFVKDRNNRDLVQHVTHYSSREEMGLAHMDILRFLFNKKDGSLIREIYRIFGINKTYKKSTDEILAKIRHSKSRKKKAILAEGPISSSWYSVMEPTSSVRLDEGMDDAEEIRENPEAVRDVEQIIQSINAERPKELEETDAENKEIEEIEIALEDKFKDRQDKHMRALYEKMEHLIEAEDAKDASAVYESVINIPRIKDYFLIEEKEGSR